MYKFLVGGKIRFLDDILTFLESKVEQQSEDIVASSICFIPTKDKFFGITYSFKTFLPKDKERLYLRVAMLHLESEKLIIKTTARNPEIPDYLISYDGIILVKNGGYSKKILLNNFKEFLQRCAWFTALLTITLNLYLNRDKIFSSNHTSTNHESQEHRTLKTEVKKQQKTRKLIPR